LIKTARRSNFRPITALRARPRRLLSRTSRIAKSLKFLLERQQEWGGWFDPKQSYENSARRRETQFAVMALSEFYKGTDGKGWQAKAPQSLSTGDALSRLQQLDGVWERPSGSVTRDLIASLGSEEPMTRMAAAAALGRVGAKEAITQLGRLLGDPSKLVQIAAAQALRRIASRSVVPPSGGSAQSRDIRLKAGLRTSSSPRSIQTRGRTKGRGGAQRASSPSISHICPAKMRSPTN